MDYTLTPEEIQVFAAEAREQLEILEEGLLSLDGGKGEPQLIDELFRAAHTLKGGAATVGLEEAAKVTHAMENVFEGVRSRGETLSAEDVDLLLATLDGLRRTLDALEKGEDLPPLGDLLQALSQARGEGEASAAASPEHRRVEKGGVLSEGTLFEIFLQAQADAPMPDVRLYQAILRLQEKGTLEGAEPPVERLGTGEDIRTMTLRYRSPASLEELEDLLKDVPDLLPARWRVLGTGKEAGDEPQEGPKDSAREERARRDEAGSKEKPAPSPGDGSTLSPGSTVRIDVALLDRLMNLVGELVIDRTRLEQLSSQAMSSSDMKEELRRLTGRLARVTGELQDSIMQARLLPIATLFRKFPRMVRDLARQLGKDVELVMVGEDTELDRSVIEKIGDPLMHLLRNALDHGVETPEERKALGKPLPAVVRLEAYHEENHIHIVVADDGRGIDPEKIRQAAVAKGLLSEAEARQLSDEEALDLIFAPGFSTASRVTSVSGRGVGTDVVRKNVEKLSGSVVCRSEKGKGTEFHIKLPLTLAIVHALLTEIQGTVFAVPVGMVTEVLRVESSEIYYTGGKPLIRLREKPVPLQDPGEVWGFRRSLSRERERPFPVVILQTGFGPLGLVVDRLLGEQEVVIKNMGPYVGQVPGIAGASILGDGRVALMVDVGSFAQGARRLA
ncbi:MAG: chemotaxis protein CheA [Clostridiales bacterium]|nr:chemotaxis protein CheA [Clostridiales bacterium]